jgi:membrane protease YdiL (CAAX protease family)
MRTYKVGIQGLLLIVFSLLLTVTGELLWVWISPLIAATMGIPVVSWTGSLNYLKGLQLVSSVTMFLLPPVLLAWFLGQKTSSMLQFHRVKSVTFWLLVIVSMLVAQPFINWLGDWNSRLSLPAWLSGVEHWMKIMEQQNETLVNRFLAVHSMQGLLFNVLFIAVIPAFAEEFFFRGAVQRLFAKKMNIHLAVWVTAFIFSAVHVEFYGFVPRMLLGAYLGYLLVWSGSIWMPILAHFVNNFLGVLIGYWLANHSGYSYLDHIGVGHFAWLSVVGVLLFVTLMWLTANQSKGTMSKCFSNDETIDL